jgi:hypothetical protein
MPDFQYIPRYLLFTFVLDHSTIQIAQKGGDAKELTEHA